MMVPLFGILNSTVTTATLVSAPAVAHLSKCTLTVPDGNYYPKFNPNHGWVPATAGCSVAAVSTATVHLPRRGWAQVRGGVTQNSWSPNLKRSSHRRMKNTTFRWAVANFTGRKRFYGNI